MTKFVIAGRLLPDISSLAAALGEVRNAGQHLTEHLPLVQFEARNIPSDALSKRRPRSNPTTKALWELVEAIRAADRLVTTARDKLEAEAKQTTKKEKPA